MTLDSIYLLSYLGRFLETSPRILFVIGRHSPLSFVLTASAFARSEEGLLFAWGVAYSDFHLAALYLALDGVLFFLLFLLRAHS